MRSVPTAGAAFLLGSIRSVSSGSYYWLASPKLEVRVRAWSDRIFLCCVQMMSLRGVLFSGGDEGSGSWGEGKWGETERVEGRKRSR